MRMVRHLTLAILTIFITVGTLQAQKPAPEGRIFVGLGAFADAGWLNHSLLGGSVRYYVTRRIGIEPEVLYMVGSGTDRDVSIIPNVSFDFRPGKPVRPYIVGGYGVLHHSNTFFGRTFGSNGPTANFGFGVRIPITPKVFFAPEFRIGWEPFLRPAGAVGFTF